MQNGILKMIDLDFEGFRKLYYRSEKNKNILKVANNWFYLANDKFKAKNERNVRYSIKYGMSGEDRKAYMGKGAVVLYMESKNLEEIKRQCEKAPKGYIAFNLKKSFGRAYISLLDFEDKEVVAFVMKNKTRPFYFPFSLEGNTSYDKASNEFLSLPYMVENDEFVEMMPKKIKDLLGIEEKRPENEYEPSDEGLTKQSIIDELDQLDF